MEIATDSIKAAAEAKCQYVELVDGFELICINGKVSMDGQVHFPHEACQGTGLKHPSLSRECNRSRITVVECHCSEEELEKDGGFHIHSGPLHDDDCKACFGSQPGHIRGRIPDVNEGEVISILLATIGFVGFQNVDDGRVCIWLEPNFPDVVYHGDTPLEAACAALMASVPSLHG